MYFWDFIYYYGSTIYSKKTKNIKAYFDDGYEIEFIEKNESVFSIFNF